MGELQTLQAAINTLIYIASGLWIFEIGKAVVGYLFHNYLDRGKDDIKQLSSRIGELERKQTECPIDTEQVRIDNLEKEQERIRNKLDSLFKH
jgi:hypothetical protein